MSAENHETSIVPFEREEIIEMLPVVVFRFRMDESGNMFIPWISGQVKRVIGVDQHTIMADPESLLSIIHQEDKGRFMAGLLASAENMSKYEETLRFAKSDGSERWATIKSNPEKQEDGSIVWTGYMEDITERKEVELGLQAESDFNRRLIVDLPVGFAIADIRTGILEMCNKALANMVGRTPEEIIGKHQSILHTGDEGTEVTETFKEHSEGEPGAGVVLRYSELITVDGEKRAVEIRARNIGGKLLGMFTDVTEQRRVEGALRANEARYEAMVANIGDVIGIMGVDGIMKYKSPNIEKLFGWKPEDFVGTNGWETVHPEDMERLQNAFRLLVAEENAKITVEYRYKCKDGSYKLIELTAVNCISNPDINGVLLNYHDISGQKQAEEALKESEERFHILFETMVEGVCLHELIYDENGKASDYRIIDANPAYAKHTDISEGQVIGKLASEIYCSVPFLDTYANVAETGESMTFEIPFEPMGKHFRISVFSPKKGQFATVFEDITKSKQMEDALRESEVRYRSIIESSVDAIMTLAPPDWNFSLGNPSAVKLFGAESEEHFASMPPWRLSPEFQPDGQPSGDKARAMINKAMEAGVNLFEWTHCTVDGTEFLADVLLSKVTINGQEVLQATVRDISERKHMEKEKARLEEDLHQSQKMESIGRLAGGVAHDFNNLLTVIMGNVDIARMDIESLGVAESLGEIQTAAKRATDLTAQLLAFSRKQKIQPRVMDLNDLIGESLKLLTKTIRENIRLKVGGMKEQVKIKADPGHMVQILMNLVINAADAMKKGGEINIETTTVRLDEDYCRSINDLESGDYAMLTVSDTGSGIKKEDLLNIFEPFFTTKGLGEGTGLGLATVYGIVKQHGGHIEVESEMGEGTTFRVYFPLVVEELSESAGRTTSFDALPRGTETILVVEDNDMVRNVAVRVLRRLGYTVISAVDGVDALKKMKEIQENQGELPELVFSDVIMPNMGGKELADRIRKSFSGMETVFATGYSDGFLDDEIDEGANFIGKPYTLKDLAEWIRAVLDAKKEAAK